MKNKYMAERKLSLYIHIPFCVRKCLYCDFLSQESSRQQRERYTDALIREIKETVPAAECVIDTVFIGGGTPTCLETDLLERLGQAVLETCQLSGAEYTIEANPGTISKEKAILLRELGGNRVSIGLQSSNDRELKKLGRIHTYQEFLEGYEIFREAGFDNINIDLMAALPGQDIASYRETVCRVLELQPEHISAYSLMIEEGTPFFQMEADGILSLPDEDTEREMYDLTDSLLSAAGYHRYEISNYAKREMECRHNLTYWNMGEYLGVGLGASSFLGGFRFRNTTDFTKYLYRYGRQGNRGKNSWDERAEQKIKKASCLQDSVWKTAEDRTVDWQQNQLSEILKGKEQIHRVSRKEAMEEFVFLGLRKIEGISAAAFEQRFGCSFYQLYRDILPGLLQKKLLAEDEKRGRIYLTKLGIDVSNQVLAEFLLEEDTTN